MKLFWFIQFDPSIYTILNEDYKTGYYKCIFSKYNSTVTKYYNDDYDYEEDNYDCINIEQYISNIWEIGLTY